MTPADEMRAAAKLLREKKQGTTRTPWHTGPEISGLKDVYGPKGEHVTSGDWPVTNAADAEWIVLMGPDKAASLATLLDVCAYTQSVYAGCSGLAYEMSFEQESALVLARSILASATPEES